jgi:DMSO/TMAO reductase YedYZ molybdopterin-dependent catalytic subunit
VRSNDPRSRLPGWAAAWAGLVAGAVALGIAQLVAGAFAPSAFPVVAVGDAVVDLSPAPLKEWAIRSFGEGDKTVLLGGILVVLTACAAGLGMLAGRRIAYGLAGLAGFGAVGLAAALGRPGAAETAVDAVAAALPTLAGAVAGCAALILLIRRAEVPPTPEESAARPAEAEAGAGAEEWPAVMRAGSDRWAVDRRALLQGTVGGLLVAGAGGFVGRALAGGRAVDAARLGLALPSPAEPAGQLPAGADLRIRGLGPFVTPNRDFYRVDTALIVPQVDPERWTLAIHGMVDRPIEITFAELLRRPLVEADVTLCCVSNEVGGPYIGNARWLGVRMADVLREAGLQADADMLLSRSADGWTCGTPVDVVMDGRDSLFAIAMNGEVLPVDHGFPVRQVIPGLYGYVSATKWVVDIKVTRFDRDEAYWTPKGWAAKGPVKTQSRIDVPSPGARVPAGRVTIAGVAWAQHRGVDAVEVRVDGGEWRLARLADVPGPDTWRQWTIDWELPAGRHRLEVRATDGTGEVQTAALAPPRPDGATGHHAVTIEVTA